ncbi:MAG: chromate resistance protein [Candidatus Binataceae bacterium]|nr:chromate resistance protein [Candidatus Binataceae bacterium]
MTTVIRSEVRWLLLIHQIPPKPDYFRVKIWRRLQRLGAIAIKNSVYALPRSDQAQEDLQWVAREITEGGGEASVCEAGFLAGPSDDQIEAMFQAARDADYAAIADEAKELANTILPKAITDPISRTQANVNVARLRRRLHETVAIDFFDALGRQTAEGLLADLDLRLKADGRAQIEQIASAASELRGRTWVTRTGLHIDRLASAWLIRRFFDPKAKFKFVPARGYRPEKGELRFDMFEADFTHEGDRCTFEVLLRRLDINDPGLRAIAEIVHDIDLKDSKFGRPETSGIQKVINGICASQKDDETRLVRGGALFDDLYEAFRRPGR